MQTTSYWEILGAVVGICALILTFSDLFYKKKKDKGIEHDNQLEEQAKIKLKIQELEGKISTQYTGLSSRLEGLERTLQEGKSNSYQFETRLVGSVDKLDSKIEGLRDLVIKIVTQQPK